MLPEIRWARMLRGERGCGVPGRGEAAARETRARLAREQLNRRRVRRRVGKGRHVVEDHRRHEYGGLDASRREGTEYRARNQSANGDANATQRSHRRLGGKADIRMFAATGFESKAAAAPSSLRWLRQWPLNAGRIAVFCPFTIGHLPSAPRCSKYTISVRSTPFPFVFVLFGCLL